MREILFRGKSKVNNKWRTGWYNPPFEYKWGYPDEEVRHSDACITFVNNDMRPDWSFVDEATVGQYTGLTDKNGKKIFEGDIVEYMDGGYKVNGVVRFGLYGSVGDTFSGHQGFYLDWAEDGLLRKDIGFWAIMRPLLVIGNIHDNPELIGSDSNDGC